jgi:Xaa-Pro aminopeptidase
VDEISQQLLQAQIRAQALFEEVAASGMIREGKTESRLSDEIFELARERYGVRRHWHKRIVRSGPNTLFGYYDECPDRQLAADDVVFLDFGPVFDGWEADFGRSYVIGNDPDKHRLVKDLATAFRRGKDLYETSTDLTAGQLYDYVAQLAQTAGWTFGAPTAGHLVGEFPHERSADTKRFQIRSGNPQRLREPDAAGQQRHWILEIHLVDRVRQFGGFLEELLTVKTP